MAYHTVTYLLVFLPLVLCIYQLVPQRTRWIVLLLSGYIFLWSFNGGMALWLAATSLFTHFICVWISSARLKQASDCRKILIFGTAALIGILGYVKYSNFFINNLNLIFEAAGSHTMLQPVKRLIPIGISFYTLQAIGYMVDVYRGKEKVSLNYGKGLPSGRRTFRKEVSEFSGGCLKR